MTPPDRKYICLGRRGAVQPGKGGHDDDALAPASTGAWPKHARTPARPAPVRCRRTTRRQAPARRGTTGWKSPTTPSASTGRRRRSCSAQPLAPRPHLVVRRAEQLDGSPQAPLPSLRDRPRPLHRRPRQRRLEGRGRALQARPKGCGPPARRATPIPRKPPAVLGAPPRGGRQTRPRADAAAVRARALADDRPSRLSRILAPSRPPRGRARPRARPRPPCPPPDPAPPRTQARPRSRRTRRARQRAARIAPD